MSGEYITVKFSSNIKCVKSVSETVITYIKSAVPSISEDILFELKVVYGELLTNAIIHGNGLISEKMVRLTIGIEEGVIFSKICDEGTGFDYINRIIPKECGDLLIESGRGLLIVSSLVDSLSFNSNGAEVEFRKAMAG